MRNESTDISTPLLYAHRKKLLIFRAYLNICAYTSHHYIGKSRALFRQNRDYLYTIHISPCDNYWLLKLFLYRLIGILHYIKPFYPHSRQIATTPYRSRQLRIFRSNDRRFLLPLLTPYRSAHPRSNTLYRKSNYTAQSFTKVYRRTGASEH